MIIVRYNEIGTKGNNRSIFENILIKNIKTHAKFHSVPISSVKKMYGRILIEANEDCLFLRNVFGIASFSTALKTHASIDALQEVVSLHFLSRITPHFRVTAQRLTGNSLSSKQVMELIGAYIVDKTHFPVQLNHPDYELFIEIINNSTYVFDSKVRGPGGMPVGSGGVVGVINETEQDLLASWLMMKRGCFVILHHSFGVEQLKRFDPLIKQSSFLDPNIKIQAIVLGQTLKTYEDSPLFEYTGIDRVDLNNQSLPILRPLIAYSEDEITQCYQQFVK